MSTLPIVITSAGLIPESPATIRNNLIAAVSAVNQGYTANLPASLIEDISSTDTYAILQCESALVDLVNSITPLGANEFLLNQFGQLYGVMLGEATNTSVLVVFTGTPGYVISPGFTVGDGTYQYVIPDGGVVGSGGTSQPLYAVATTPGTWAVPANSVVNLVTSVPDGISLVVTNPQDGVPATTAETAASYRARVLQAGLAASQGMSRYLKTLVANIPGVQPRLVSARQKSPGWEIIVGGGDPVAVGYAIWQSLFDISNLVPSVISVTGITKANPGVVTTDLNHGYSTGQVVTMYGILGMTELNGVPVTIVKLTETTFSIGVNTTSYTTYTSGGYCTPNFRNVSASIYDFPDTYSVPIVVPPQQTVAITVTWNTTSPAIISQTAMAQYGSVAIADYINLIPVGQPINEFEMTAVFQAATASILPTQLLTRLVFSVSINGNGASPVSGTGIINGDPESFFYTTAEQITVNQG